MFPRMLTVKTVCSPRSVGKWVCVWGGGGYSLQPVLGRTREREERVPSLVPTRLAEKAENTLAARRTLSLNPGRGQKP